MISTRLHRPVRLALVCLALFACGPEEGEEELNEGTAALASAELRVASFNLFGVNNDAKAAGDAKVWSERRASAIADILGEKADVVGLQEANQSSTYAAQLEDGVNQFLDLKLGLQKAGAPYALTNEVPYNCVRATSSKDCVYQDRGASRGTRILYNADTVEKVSSGSFMYVAQTAGKIERYLAYAVFKWKATGRQFFFATTHLDPYDPAIRKAEWKELIERVNGLKGALPVVVVGDFNHSKFAAASEEMLPAMKAAGYGDVLNQEYRTNPIRAPRAQSVVNGWINSYNGFRRDLTPYSYDDRREKAGNNIDWIFATNALVVKQWKVVVDYDDATLRLTGTIPSDHNMVRATLVLP